MVAVSIVVHKTPASQLLNAVRCVLRSPAVGRVDIVDNSPDNNLQGELQGLLGEENRVRYRHVENRGFGAGHNISIRESLADGADYHLVMNADVDWQGDVLSPIVDFIDKHPDVGLLSPKIRYPDGMLQYACRMLPTPFDLFAKRFLPSWLTRKRMRRYLLADIDHDKEFEVPYLLGSFLFFRSQALKDVGLFDERFFMYPEDIDISRRIHRNWKTLYWPGVEIVHHHAAASRRNMQMLRVHFSNMICYFNKWGWLFDRERRRFNRRLLATAPRTSTPPPGRG